MKKIGLLFYAIPVLFLAQIPAGYYNTATGTGYTLKTQLYNIIKNNTNSITVDNYGDLWILFANNAFKDLAYENDGTLLDIYTEKPTTSDTFTFTVPAGQCGSGGYTGEGDCYNREHVIPKCYYGGDDSYPMYSDAHFVLPVDGYINGIHNNFPYGKVATATYSSSNGTKKGNNLNSGYSAGYSGTVFEVIDAFKGDIARAYFYFATRYEPNLTSFYSSASVSSCNAKDMFNGTQDQTFTNTFKQILLTWHAIDPVSPYEIAKNNAVYYNFQNNRNPFIDHPEYVEQIWGSLDVEEIEYQESSYANVYPTYITNGKAYVESLQDAEIKEILVFNASGQQLQNIRPTNNSTLTEVSIPTQSGMYFIKILGNGFEVNRQVIVK